MAMVATSIVIFGDEGAVSMKKLAWGLVALDILVAIGLTIALGLLASVFLGSGNSPDRTIGVVVALGALAALAHPGLGIWLARKEKHTGAAVFSGICVLLGGGFMFLASIFLQAAVTP